MRESTPTAPMPARRCSPWLAVLLLMAPAAHAADFVVGAGCTYTSLQDALAATLLNGPDMDTIRVVRNQTYAGEYLVQNQSVRIVGGYDSCSDTTASGQTTIDRAPSERNFTLETTNATPRTIELAHLHIVFGGAGSSQQTEGGAIHVSGGHSLSLEETTVSGGLASDGGGIFLDGSSLTLDAESAVINNTAISFGGGVACENDGNVYLTGGLVTGNTANFGGGISLGSGCDLEHHAGGPLQGIVLNSASHSGGGIYASGAGTQVFLVGSSAHPAVVSDNEATDSGGGIKLDGTGVEGYLMDAQITLNEATNGGGLGVDLGALLVMDRTLGADCHDSVACSQLSGNTAGNNGGAVYVSGGDATAIIRQTDIRGNTGGAAVGGVSNGTLVLEGSVVAGNFGITMVQVTSNGTFEGRFLTVADNRISNDSAGNTFYRVVATTATVRVLSSIVDDPPGLVYGGVTGGATHLFDCTLVHESASLSGPDFTTSFLTAGDPLFVNRATGDFHLQPGSPVIDFCDGFFTGSAVACDLPTIPSVDAPDCDVDNAERRFDVAGLSHAPLGMGANAHFDLGADEWSPIFADGFESGATGAWSLAVP